MRGLHETQIATRYQWLLISLFAVLSGLVYYLLGYQVDRTSFQSVLLCFVTLFAGAYAVIRRSHNHHTFVVLCSLGVVFRVLLVGALPELSDDYFRFVWDGMLSANGVSPYANIPSELAVSASQTCLFEHLNSPHYYSVYPALNQLIYWFSVELGETTLGAVMVMKTLMVLAEMGTLLLLIRLFGLWQIDRRHVLIYALNPLVVMEFTGNLHFEGFMVFFLVLAVYAFQTKRWVLGAFAMACAINLKILPVLFLPFVWRRLGPQKSVITTGLVVIICGIQFLPFYDENMVSHIFESMQLYFSSFEFNSSIYQWIYVLPHWSKPVFTNVLKVVFLTVYIWYFLKVDDRTWRGLFQAIVVLFTAYFLLGSSVHPWYVAALLPFAVAFRLVYVEVWLCLLPLTYATYRFSAYEQVPGFILMEYLLVFGVIAWQWSKSGWGIKKGP